MFCINCGKHVQDGVHFCDNCGASLQAPGGVSYQQPAPARTSSRAARPQDPYKEPIKQLKLQIKQLKLDLKQINTKMGNTRSTYNETRAWLPSWELRHGEKMLEDALLWKPQINKQQLQQQILQLEQQLLGLQQQQAQWQAQQD
jgi:zinc-ribbon domain